MLINEGTLKLLRAEVADIPERNFSFVARKNVADKYNVETVMNGRAEQDDSTQFDPGHQNPCTITKASFTRSPIKGKRRTRLWHVLAGILDTE
jgi:hypothetical protein